MKISNILVSQPAPGNTQSPFSEITSKYGVQVDYFPFFRIEPLTAKEFRTQKVAILDYTAIFFSAKSSIDAFFSVCEAMRVTVPETMKYFCTTENIALYLQKHIVYRKRKIFFGKGTIESVMEAIGPKHKGENFLIASTDTTIRQSRMSSRPLPRPGSSSAMPYSARPFTATLRTWTSQSTRWWCSTAPRMSSHWCRTFQISNRTAFCS